MAPNASSQPDRPPRRDRGSDGPPPSGPGPQPSGRRSTGWALVQWLAITAVLIGAFVAISLVTAPTSPVTERSYTELMADVRADRVESITISSTTGSIDGVYKSGSTFKSRGPAGGLPAADLSALDAHGVARSYEAPSKGLGRLGSVLGFILPLVLIVALFIWLSRRSTGGAAGAAAFGRQPGPRVHHRAAGHDLRRRRRLRGREGGRPGGRRVPPRPGDVPGDRCPHPQGRPPRRAARHGQDPDGPGRRRRGGRAVHLGHGLALHGDVRRCRRGPGARPLPGGPAARAVDRVRGRDRLDRPQARRRDGDADTTSATRP